MKIKGLKILKEVTDAELAKKFAQARQHSDEINRALMKLGTTPISKQTGDYLGEFNFKETKVDFILYPEDEYVGDEVHPQPYETYAFNDRSLILRKDGIETLIVFSDDIKQITSGKKYEIIPDILITNDSQLKPQDKVRYSHFALTNPNSLETTGFDIDGETEEEKELRGETILWRNMLLDFHLIKANRKRTTLRERASYFEFNSGTLRLVFETDEKVYDMVFDPIHKIDFEGKAEKDFTTRDFLRKFNLSEFKMKRVTDEEYKEFPDITRIQFTSIKPLFKRSRTAKKKS